MSKEILTIQGLQFGSEAKGAIALLTAQTWLPDAVGCAWQPNAGHTVYIDGNKYVHRMLPVGALAPSVKTIFIGPGATLDIPQLRAEIAAAGGLLQGKVLIIHPNAAVLGPMDAENESALVSIGSTMKGSMRAQVRKMGRKAFDVDTPATAQEADFTWGNDLPMGPRLYVSGAAYDTCMDNVTRLQLEGAQGFSLGMHSRFYPYCTSRDVSTAQLLADCRVPFPEPEALHTIGVCRTFPIRVANRFKEGIQVGTSGPCYSDQRELSWEDLGREAELTTVTKLPRRVFTFSIEQIREAARIMRPTVVALTFCDYLGNPSTRPWGLYAPAAVEDLIGPIEAATKARVRYLTFGPEAAQQYEIANEAGLLRQPQSW